MADVRSLLEAIDRLYGAVATPTAWSSALEGITDLLRAEDAFTYAPGSGELPFASVRMETAQAARYCSPESVRFITPLVGRLPIGRAVSSASVMPDHDFEMTPFYNEIVRPGKTFYSASARLGEPGQAATFLCFCRRRGVGAFEMVELDRLQIILPHLGNALELRRRLRVVQRQNDDLLTLLDSVDTGVILVDAEARPGFLNARAATLVALSDGLTVGPGGVAAARPDETRALRRAIAAVSRLGARLSLSDPVDAILRSATAAAGTRLRLSRPSGRLPLVVTVTPLGEAGLDGGRDVRPQVAVFVAEPDGPPEIRESAVAEVFGLTPREATIAVRLAQGAELSEIAAALDLGLATVRSHLKQVFGKTGTNRQTDLVRLVLRGFSTPRPRRE